jgi:hypothetical protein
METITAFTDIVRSYLKVNELLHEKYPVSKVEIAKYK